MGQIAISAANLSTPQKKPTVAAIPFNSELWKRYTLVRCIQDPSHINQIIVFCQYNETSSKVRDATIAYDNKSNIYKSYPINIIGLVSRVFVNNILCPLLLLSAKELKHSYDSKSKRYSLLNKNYHVYNYNDASVETEEKSNSIIIIGVVSYLSISREFYAIFDTKKLEFRILRFYKVEEKFKYSPTPKNFYDKSTRVIFFKHKWIIFFDFCSIQIYQLNLDNIDDTDDTNSNDNDGNIGHGDDTGGGDHDTIAKPKQDYEKDGSLLRLVGSKNIAHQPDNNCGIFIKSIKSKKVNVKKQKRMGVVQTVELIIFGGDKMTFTDSFRIVCLKFGALFDNFIEISDNIEKYDLFNLKQSYSLYSQKLAMKSVYNYDLSHQKIYNFSCFYLENRYLVIIGGANIYKQPDLKYDFRRPQNYRSSRIQEQSECILCIDLICQTSHMKTSILPKHHNQSIHESLLVTKDNGRDETIYIFDNINQPWRLKIFYAMTWKRERIIWIAFYKNVENNQCLMSKLPKSIVGYIIKLSQWSIFDDKSLFK